MPSLLNSVSVVPVEYWLAFSLAVLVLLIIDLSLFGRGSHAPSRKKALLESALWVAISLGFNLWFGIQYGSELGTEFLTGYLIEKSLSVDNLFVILLIFSSFRVPAEHQHRVLFYGVLGAIVMRAFFIVLGAQLLHTFHWILYLFGGILIVTGIRFLRETDDQEDVRDSAAVRLFKRLIPTTETFHGRHFFIREQGVLRATPLFFALVVIEVTDLIFAVDSIPAVFAVTNDAFVAFASNILAVLGLRALYFVLADWAGQLRYLKPGLATILVFIGVKMIVVDIWKIPSWISLLVIAAILTTAALGSWYVAKLEMKKPN